MNSPIERLLAKLDRSGDCWVFTGALARGYGRFASGAGRVVQAHRFAYEHYVGPIPEGLQLDHLCRNRACCNPAHLEPVTHRVNTLRGNTVSAAAAARTHCPSGHEYSEANTYHWRGKRGRQCRECHRIHEANRRARCIEHEERGS